MRSRSCRGSRWRGCAGSLLAAGLVVGTALPAGAAWRPPDVDLSRPRILFRSGQEDALRARCQREPYRQMVLAMSRRAALAEGVAPGDESKEAQRFRARAAKVGAFLYALGLRVAGGQVLAFTSPAERRAAGDRVRDALLQLYPRSRLAVPEPLGGWDRDISSSEELLQWATAYDTLGGAGYPFDPADEAEIRRRIADLASELYENYLHPDTAGGNARLHQNNHRSKTGAALVVAGIALAAYQAPAGSDPQGLRDPARWIAYGLEQVDRVMRDVLVAGDGAYGEGPFYFRFASQNLLPMARAWDRLAKGRRSDDPALGLPVHRPAPDLWRHPLFRRSVRWALDMTLADGRLAAQDDGSPNRAYYFGAAPMPGDAPGFAWRYAHAPAPYDGDGNIDLGPDAVVVYDDRIAPAPPRGPSTRFYPEGGNAIFRSDWGPEAVVAIVQGEHGPAAEFGRSREGDAVFPQSHEHREPGAFLLDGYGERLLLDPGYKSFFTRNATNAPQHHNMILVDGRGPVEYLFASFAWGQNPSERPPADGLATLSHELDTGFVDAARVTTRYGTGDRVDPLPGAPRIERRFFFVSERTLLVADRVDSEPGRRHAFAWMLQGNAGEDAGGSFELRPGGARWTRPRARLDARFAFDSGLPALSSQRSPHITNGKQIAFHRALRVETTGAHVRSLAIVEPSPVVPGQAPPELTELSVAEGVALQRVEPATDRWLAAFHRDGRGTRLELRGAGMQPFASDGRLGFAETGPGGALRSAFAEEASWLEYAGVRRLEAPAPARLGLSLRPGAAEILAEGGAPEVAVGGLAFLPRSADGACALDTRSARTRLRLGRGGRAVLRAAPGNSAPAADPGPDRTARVGEVQVLDAGASCDLDGDPLRPRWELVSAPPGSDWQLAGSRTFRPTLAIDRVGTYRVELVVTDSHGAASRPVRLRIEAGPRCGNGEDDDLDGLFDRDDPDCDEPAGPVSTAASPACGLGFELAPALALAALLRRRPRPDGP